jgi:ABC-type phosphate transport system substrate-binding protein
MTSKRGWVAGAVVMALALQGGMVAARSDADDIAVIVNRSNGVAAMSRSQLGAIFKAKSSQFPGGARATPVNLPPESPTRRAFDSAVLGLSPDEVERFWVDSKIRSGVGSPPKLPGPAALVRFVSANESGIGYVPSSEVSDAVRVVARVRGGEVVAP